MHLRLPIVAGIVALAACGAVLRARVTSDSSPPHLTLRTETARTDLATEAPGANGRRIRAARAAPAPEETIVVYVAGEVAHAGLYTLPERSRAADAVRAAGGARPDADLVALNLAAPLGDGDEVAVSAVGADAPPRARRRTHGRSSSFSDIAAGDANAPPKRHRKKKRSHRRHAATSLASAESAGATAGDGPTETVDLNTADATELETLPGIGPTLAERIVAFRDASGPFASPDDLLDVGGMTQGKLDTVLPFVVVVRSGP